MCVVCKKNNNVESPTSPELRKTSKRVRISVVVRAGDRGRLFAWNQPGEQALLSISWLSPPSFHSRANLNQCRWPVWTHTYLCHCAKQSVEQPHPRPTRTPAHSLTFHSGSSGRSYWLGLNPFIFSSFFTLFTSHGGKRVQNTAIMKVWKHDTLQSNTLWRIQLTIIDFVLKFVFNCCMKLALGKQVKKVKKII